MIVLKALIKSDVYSFFKWINDPEVIKYSLSLFEKINTEKEISDWFTNLINDKKDVKFGIFLKSTNELIGYAGICNISTINKSGEYSIVSLRKLYKIRNASFGNIFTFFNSLMLRHNLISVK